MAKIIELIYTEERVTYRHGKEDISRMVPQLWTKDGKLIAQHDAVEEFSEFNPDGIK